MTHVVIRCDASAEGGVGHLVRALSVADAAQAAGHTVAVAGAIESPLAERLLADSGLEATDATENLEILAAEQGATVVHVDDYAIGAEAREQVRACGALLSSIEDGTFGRRPADVVVDPTLRTEWIARPEDGSGTVLLGIDYAPMRADVRAARERRPAEARDIGPAARVLIVMGGTDATGAAGTLAAVCSEAESIGQVSVIAPERNWDEVRAEAGDGIDLIAPSTDFLERASAADLVVSAAGTTAWELACIGVPSLLVAVVANQKAGYAAALTERIACGLGSLEQVRADQSAATAAVEEAVAALRTVGPWTRVGREEIDGRGAERIVAAWDAALSRRVAGEGSPLRARPATIQDSSLLLRWRNDPVTRKVSRASSLITWQSHQDWYERTLENPNRELYVIERGTVPLGTVRFDALEGSEWEVSITLAPEARGHGHSRSVLTAGEAVFDARQPNATVVAAIHRNNLSSQRLFAGAGYLLDSTRCGGEFLVFVRRDPS